MVGFINTSSVMTLVIGALILAVIAVVIDRLNFPQRRFRAKQIKPADRGTRRDRTGAHIVDVTTEIPADSAADIPADSTTDETSDSRPG